MKSAKSLSFEATTWLLIEQYMKTAGIDEASLAAEDLVLAGAEAKKVKTK